MGSSVATVGAIASGGKSILRPVDNLLGTSMSGGNAYTDAYNAQSGATGQANNALTNAYNSQVSYLNPYQQAGGQALSQLTSGNLVDSNSLQNDAGYQFRLKEGLNAINSSAAASGGLNSGATLKALTQYGQNFASNEYNNAYNREYNRLSQLAGYGSNASNNLASAAGQYGTNISNNYMGLGNAGAASSLAQANNQSNLIGQGVTAAAMFSDERLKENIVEISKEDFAEMKKHLKAYAFNYRSKKYGEGNWVGVMAQDLEKSKLGRTLVVENENGEKTIDLRKVLSMFLATIAEA